MGQRHVCTFRHALRAAYRTAISSAQILVFISVSVSLFSSVKQCIFYCMLHPLTDSKKIAHYTHNPIFML